MINHKTKAAFTGLTFVQVMTKNQSDDFIALTPLKNIFEMNLQNKMIKLDYLDENQLIRLNIFI